MLIPYYLGQRGWSPGHQPQASGPTLDTRKQSWVNPWRPHNLPSHYRWRNQALSLLQICGRSQAATLSLWPEPLQPGPQLVSQLARPTARATTKRACTSHGQSPKPGHQPISLALGELLSLQLGPGQPRGLAHSREGVTHFLVIVLLGLLTKGTLFYKKIFLNQEISQTYINLQEIILCTTVYPIQLSQT